MIREVTIQTYNRIFWKFVSKYDISNDNILRKIIHSYSVAEKCYSIACTLKLDKKQREFCYLIGLFHDAGRFEQWKMFQTYNDKISVDHGDLGAKILKVFDAKCLKISKKQQKIMCEAIKWHTKFYAGEDKEVKFFNKIIKNADAFANIIATANGAQQMTTTNDGVTQEILTDFLERKTLLKYSPKTKLDRALMLTASVYYIEYDFIRKEILQKNYIDCIFETFSQYLNDKDKETYFKAVECLKQNDIQ